MSALYDTTPLDFLTLRHRNVERCEASYHAIDAWSPTDWACALAGEVGETCNLVKKLRRLDLTDSTTLELIQNPAAGDLIRDIADELADTVIYADLLAERLNINLGEAVRRKFNETSQKIESGVRL
jgi:NTP pyrophosphatase (non-canonical NTP hydrolase)